jgi:hypothetical protein
MVNRGLAAGKRMPRNLYADVNRAVEETIRANAAFADMVEKSKKK